MPYGGGVSERVKGPTITWRKSRRKLRWNVLGLTEIGYNNPSGYPVLPRCMTRSMLTRRRYVTGKLEAVNAVFILSGPAL